MNMSNTIIVCAIGASIFTPPTLGQSQQKPRYRITDLGELITGPDESIARAFGLNDKNFVTGEATTDLDAKHAFIWLPVPFIPLNLTDGSGTHLKGMFDIGPGPGSSDESAGYDINENSWITGKNQFDNALEFHTFLWDPNQTAASFLRMDNKGVLPPESNMPLPCREIAVACEPPRTAKRARGWPLMMT